ncbi:MAG: hypothetical protein SOU32_02335, partial [Lachnospiraceae bacterium]|nr:hypothetical protein [Lachnospiraceae bacterium]
KNTEKKMVSFAGILSAEHEEADHFSCCTSSVLFYFDDGNSSGKPGDEPESYESIHRRNRGIIRESDQYGYHAAEFGTCLPNQDRFGD